MTADQPNKVGSTKFRWNVVQRVCLKSKVFLLTIAFNADLSGWVDLKECIRTWSLADLRITRSVPPYVMSHKPVHRVRIYSGETISDGGWG